MMMGARTSRTEKSNRALFTAFIVLLLACTCGGVFGRQKLIVFPDKRSTSPSPNRRYLLINIDNGEQNPPHKLLLKDMQAKTETTLLTYPRWIATLWSPRGDRLIVNDHAGSNYSDAYVFVFSHGVRHINIQEQLKRDFPGNPTLFQNDHVYIDGVRWMGENRIEIKVYGHGSANPGGFVEYFEYRLGAKISKLRSKYVK